MSLKRDAKPVQSNPPQPARARQKTPVLSASGNSLPAVPTPRKPPAIADRLGRKSQIASLKAVRVHLASYRVVVNARRGWEQLARHNSDLLGGLSADIQRVDVGEKGVYYRLYAAPLTSSAAAVELCRKLRQRGVFCEPDNS
jgi:hypothetical protein